MSTAPARDRLVEALRPTVAEVGLDLEDVEVTPVGRRRLLRVIVDKDGGVTLDEVSEATRLVSRRLDDDEDLTGEAAYTLEVTSPGTDRPLTQPRHWRRNRRRKVVVKRRDGVTVSGRIADADESSVTLDVDGSAEQVAYSEIETARVQVEFNRKGG